MRAALVLATLLLVTNCHAATVTLTQIRLSWPLDQSGNPFRLSTSATAYLEFATTPDTLSLDFDVAADANANVSALVADMRNGTDDTLTLSVGTFSNGKPESWFFGDDFDDVDGTGLRRLDYVTRDYSALATGIDWSKIDIQSFHVDAVGPISPTLPDRALVVIDVLGVVPEPSTLLLLSTTAPWRLRRRSQLRGR